ncbi:hypothetical protein [Sharpea azabuensis]|uniref:hypothetical protein n=1 Tax=Sharpea azabuensis TaxID=322505 RepID=UPI001569F240|nr:hypothetical protein [Sharpea azabuensis]
MGMMIEEEVKNIKEQLADVSAKYRMMQADYENRLKADLEAILVELQIQFEEKGCENMRDCWWLLEEKINSLKEAKDGENND